MKLLVSLVLLLALAATVAPTSAVTLNGRAGTDSWMVTYGGGGQLIITLHWKTKNALLFMTGSCDDGTSFVSGSLQDRFQRVEVGTDPGATCEIVVQARGGASKYWINFQGTGVFGATTPDLKVEKRRGKQSAAPLDLTEHGKKAVGPAGN